MAHTRLGLLCGLARPRFAKRCLGADRQFRKLAKPRLDAAALAVSGFDARADRARFFVEPDEGGARILAKRRFAPAVGVERREAPDDLVDAPADGLAFCA